MNNVGLLTALAGGALSFVSPCVLPLVPPYLCYIGGVTIAELEQSRAERAATRSVIVAAIAFVLGFSTVFVALGATASVIGQARHRAPERPDGRRRHPRYPDGAAFPRGVPLRAPQSRGARARSQRRAGLARRLSPRARLRLWLDALHRTGARRHPRRCRRVRYCRPRRVPARRLFAGARASLHRRRCSSRRFFLGWLRRLPPLPAGWSRREWAHSWSSPASSSSPAR